MIENDVERFFNVVARDPCRDPNCLEFVWMSLENQIEFVKIAVASSQSLIKPRNLKEINMS